MNGVVRLIAAVSELGLVSAAQAAPSGSLVDPAWVGAAPAFFLEPYGVFLVAKLHSGWWMLNTVPVWPYQVVIKQLENCLPQMKHTKKLNPKLGAARGGEM